MSSNNPTVPINVTAKELRVLSGLLGYDTPCTTLRDKLNGADDAMRLATRQKNREAKAARREREDQ
jgi:hypothetical protein